jgi:hypothetical protein
MYSEHESAKATVLVITFDQGIDTATLGDSTFSLNYPAPTQVINTQQLIAGSPSSSTVSVPGTWSFTTNELGQTVATFTPAAAYQQNTLYTATLLGADASLTGGCIKNQAGESLAQSYQWSFTTGVLDLKTRSLPLAATKTPRARARKLQIARPGRSHLSTCLQRSFTTGPPEQCFLSGRHAAAGKLHR